MKRLKQLWILLLSFLVASSVFAMEKISPIGYWKTIDDATGQPKGIVQIWAASDHTIHGKIMKVFAVKGQDQKTVCQACEGEKHNQPIVGLTIMENLQPNKEKPNEWQNGTILDPKNGRTYKCNIRLADNGQKLQVRGYMGLPLFGRTQTWLKTNNF